MKTPPIPAGFSDTFAAHERGVLAFFDLADTQLRNSFLGHSVVDIDINEFESILASSGTTILISSRIAGDKWAAILAGSDTKVLGEIITRFERRQLAEVGWTVTARKRFRFSRTRKSVHTSYFHRSLRCVYLQYGASDELSQKWDLVYDRIAYARVGRTSDVQDSQVFISDVDREPRWRCIDLSVLPRSCPYCDGSNFDWCDGDNSFFGASGTCRKCKASVDFQDSFQRIAEREILCNNRKDQNC